MLFTRLLPLLCLLPLSSPALSQDGKPQPVPETCAVTNPLEHPYCASETLSGQQGH
jgi:hypothetical protein